MAFNVGQFKSRFQDGGARPNLFQVDITLPPILGIPADISRKISFLAKAAALPSSSVGTYEVPYFGRTVKFAGDRVFDNWPVSIINSEDFDIRNAMERWSNLLNSHVSNTRALPGSYKVDAFVTQYSKNQTVLRKYKFEGLHPVSIGPIGLSWENNNTVEEFDVDFQYDLWTVDDGGTTGISTT
jgi:hypothetical protein